MSTKESVLFTHFSTTLALLSLGLSYKEIKELAVKLGNEMGGWIFHNKIDWSAKTPHIKAKHKARDFIEN